MCGDKLLVLQKHEKPTHMEANAHANKFEAFILNLHDIWCKPWTDPAGDFVQAHTHWRL